MKLCTKDWSPVTILTTGDDLYTTQENHDLEHLTDQDLLNCMATLNPSSDGMVDGKTEGLLYSLFGALQCDLNEKKLNVYLQLRDASNTIPLLSCMMDSISLIHSVAEDTMGYHVLMEMLV